jgi:predicted component of type VI protein secretion system
MKLKSQSADDPITRAFIGHAMKVHSAVGPGLDKEIYHRLGIGRGKANDIVLDDNQVSTNHCELVLENGEIRINDLRSTNGTWVNGVTIYGSRKLETGDVLTIGRVKLRILF